MQVPINLVRSDGIIFTPTKPDLFTYTPEARAAPTLPPLFLDVFYAAEKTAHFAQCRPHSWIRRGFAENDRKPETSVTPRKSGPTLDMAGKTPRPPEDHPSDIIDADLRGGASWTSRIVFVLCDVIVLFEWHRACRSWRIMDCRTTKVVSEMMNKRPPPPQMPAADLFFCFLVFSNTSSL